MSVGDAGQQKKKLDPASGVPGLSDAALGDLLRARFGDDVIHRLIAHDATLARAPLAVRDAAPFTWIEVVTPLSFPRKLVVDAASIREGHGIEGMTALIEQGVTADYAVEELARRAAMYVGVRLIETKKHVDDLSYGGPYRQPATRELIERYEPPHFEERCFVFFAEIASHRHRGEETGGVLARIVVDTEAWSVRHEVLGASATQQQRQVFLPAAHDDGDSASDD